MLHSVAIHWQVWICTSDPFSVCLDVKTEQMWQKSKGLFSVLKINLCTTIAFHQIQLNDKISSLLLVNTNEVWTMFKVRTFHRFSLVVWMSYKWLWVAPCFYIVRLHIIFKSWSVGWSDDHFKMYSDSFPWLKHAESAPYGTVYLSPPTDNSWRRWVLHALPQFPTQIGNECL